MRFATNETSLNETLMFVQSIFRNVWTDVNMQRCLRTQRVVFLRGKTSYCISPVDVTLYKTVDESEVNRHIQNNTALKYDKNCAN